MIGVCSNPNVLVLGVCSKSAIVELQFALWFVVRLSVHEAFCSAVGRGRSAQRALHPVCVVQVLRG